MNRILISGLSLAALTLSAAEISNVQIRQNRPWNTRVTVSYTVSGVTAAEPLDLVPTMTANGGVLRISESALEGASFTEVANGDYAFSFDPAKTCYTNESVWADFRLTLDLVPSRRYMIVDLDAGKSNIPSARVTYTNVVVGANGQWDDYYKTNAIVLRRIPAGTFQMGKPGLATTHQVTLTKPYYMAVFEMTLAQVKALGFNWTDAYSFGVKPYCPKRPIERLAYDNIQGAGIYATGWPTNATALACEVDSKSILGRLRTKVNNELLFDIPTEAQWEYACRAGTDTDLNSGKAMSDANMNEVGRYWNNGGSAALTNQTSAAKYYDYTMASEDGGVADVGQYAPNAWGLYDMHGNVYEACKDMAAALNNAYYSTAEAAVDPVGPPQHDHSNQARCYRISRSGRWCLGSSNCSSYSRGYHYTPWAASGDVAPGIRLICPVPTEK